MNRAVAWLCAEEQDRRFEAMLEDMDRAFWAEQRRREASGEGQADREILAAKEQREAAERARAQLATIDASRGPRRPGGKSDRERASAYLATMDAGPGGAWRASLVMVRGFALDTGEAFAMLASEFAPRYHRVLPERELRGMVLRAARARVEMGWMLKGSVR